MRIGVDIRCLVEGRKTGVEEYAVNLLENLFALDKKNDYVLFLNSFRRPKISPDLFKKYENVQIKIFRFPNKLLNFLFWYLRWPKIDKMIGGADVVFLPNIIFAGFSKNVKVVAAAHDLSFERYPETFSWKRRLWHLFINPRRLYRRADKIIAVSRSTKNDLMEIYQISPSKIETVSSAVSQKFHVMDRNDPRLISVKNKYNLPYLSILYLGTLEPRKNIIGLVRAYNQLRKINHPVLNKYKLVIAGSKGWKCRKIFSEIENSPYRGDIVIAGFIEDEDKPLVYNLASLFVYPSFFEGFGFPPLEAMKCGVPVIASNNSSLPEITGDGAVLTDPDKPDEIYRAMKEILLNKELQNRLAEKGLKNAKRFNWKKTAGEYCKIFESLNSEA